VALELDMEEFYLVEFIRVITGNRRAGNQIARFD